MSRTSNTSSTPSSGPDLSAAKIIESMPDAVVVADESGEIVAANSAAEELFECRAGALLGRDQSRLHPAEDAALYEEAFRRGLEDETVERLQDGRPLYVETATGERKPVEINARRLQNQEQRFVLGVFREVTSRIEREQQLRETTTRLNTLLDSAPLPVAVLDCEGYIELWNRASEETFGYEASEMIGERYPLFVDRTQLDRLLDRVISGDTLEGYRTALRARDGSRISVEIYARPLYEDGTVTGVIGSAVDITDQQRRQQHLDVVHRLLRHNLRNNLSVVQSYASMLTNGTDPKVVTTAEAGEKITDAAEDLAQLSEHAAQVRQEITATETISCSLSTLLGTIRDVVDDTPGATVAGPTAGASVSAQTNRAVSWLLTRIVEHTDDPAVQVKLELRETYVNLDISGNAPLLPAGDAALITAGTETALEHGQDMDVARAYLTLTSVGGELLQTSDARSSFRVEIPRLDAGHTPTDAG